MPLAVHVGAGVFVGSLLAGILLFHYYAWQIERSAAAAALQLTAAMQASQESAQRVSAQAAARARQVEMARQAAVAAAQRADEQRKQQQLAEQERREEAWARFYRKPARCDEARGGSWTVDCANEFIRARKAFADSYR